MRVLVTGGTGFIGRHLVPALVASGYQVRLFLPPGSVGSRLPQGLPVEIALGRMPDLYALRMAVRGVDAVVHLATGEHTGNVETLYDVDIRGTRNLLIAAREARVRFVLALSHLGAHPDSAFRVLRAKGQVESLLKKSGVPWVVVRSAWVYGPHDHFLTPLLRWLPRLPWVPLPGGGQTALQPLWVEDLVAALILLMAEPPLGQTIEVGGPEHVLWRDLITRLQHALGRTPRLVYVPMSYARTLVYATAFVWPRAMGLLFWLDYMALDRTTQPDILPRRFGLMPQRLWDRLPELLPALTRWQPRIAGGTG